MNRAWPPADSIAATSSFPPASSRPVAITSAPSEASRAAMARPMPEVAPVTRAVFPRNLMGHRFPYQAEWIV